MIRLDGGLDCCRRDRSRARSGVLVKLIDKEDDLTFGFGGFREDSLHAGGELAIGLRTLCQGIKTQAKDAFPAQSVRHVAESEVNRYATSNGVAIEIGFTDYDRRFRGHRQTRNHARDIRLMVARCFQLASKR